MYCGTSYREEKCEHGVRLSPWSPSLGRWTQRTEWIDGLPGTRGLMDWPNRAAAAIGINAVSDLLLGKETLSVRRQSFLGYSHIHVANVARSSWLSC